MSIKRWVVKWREMRKYFYVNGSTSKFVETCDLKQSYFWQSHQLGKARSLASADSASSTKCPFQSPQKDLSPSTYYCLQWSAFGSLYVIILGIQKSHYRWPVLCWQQTRSPGIPSRWSADDQLIDATSNCPASPSGSLLTWVTPGVKQCWQLWCTVCSDIRRTKMFLLHFTLFRSSF